MTSRPQQRRTPSRKRRRRSSDRVGHAVVHKRIARIARASAERQDRGSQREEAAVDARETSVAATSTTKTPKTTSGTEHADRRQRDRARHRNRHADVVQTDDRVGAGLGGVVSTRRIRNVEVSATGAAKVRTSSPSWPCGLRSAQAFNHDRGALTLDLVKPLSKTPNFSHPTTRPPRSRVIVFLLQKGPQWLSRTPTTE